MNFYNSFEFHVINISVIILIDNRGDEIRNSRKNRRIL